VAVGRSRALEGWGRGEGGGSGEGVEIGEREGYVEVILNFRCNRGGSYTPIQLLNDFFADI